MNKELLKKCLVFLMTFLTTPQVYGASRINTLIPIDEDYLGVKGTKLQHLAAKLNLHYELELDLAVILCHSRLAMLRFERTGRKYLYCFFFF